MRIGGNKRWRSFWENHEDTKAMGLKWEDTTVRERYESAVGEEYKERLSSEVEGRAYVKPTPIAKPPQNDFQPPPRASTTSSLSNTRSGSPALSGNKAKVDAAYFTRLGSANSARPADLPPNQGGKYGGFGSEMPSPPTTNDSSAPPGIDEFQRDPVAAFTKGFGWFGGVVNKTAQTVQKNYVAPAAQRLADIDTANISSTARMTASQLARSAQSAAATATMTAQQGSRGLEKEFNRFVEGGDGGRKPLDESKTDFWESFGMPKEEKGLGSRAMGTGQGGHMGGFESESLNDMGSGVVERNSGRSAVLETDTDELGRPVGGVSEKQSKTPTTTATEKTAEKNASADDGWEKW